MSRCSGPLPMWAAPPPGWAVSIHSAAVELRCWGSSSPWRRPSAQTETNCTRCFATTNVHFYEVKAHPGETSEDGKLPLESPKTYGLYSIFHHKCVWENETYRLSSNVNSHMGLTSLRGVNLNLFFVTKPILTQEWALTWIFSLWFICVISNKD